MLYINYIEVLKDNVILMTRTCYVWQFFEPLNPVNVFVHYNDDGRATGGANVDFSSLEELTKALKRHNSTMREYRLLLYRNTHCVVVLILIPYAHPHPHPHSNP